MERTYLLKTARRAVREGLNPSRKYGYVIQIVPPVVTTQARRIPPRKLVQNLYGWYKYKSDALKRVEELNRQ